MEHFTVNENGTLKLKRQVRDYFNKNIHDLTIIVAVASVIGYKNGIPLTREQQCGHCALEKTCTCAKCKGSDVLTLPAGSSCTWHSSVVCPIFTKAQSLG